MVTEMSIERLQQTEAWYGLSPILKEVLTLHFRIGGDLVEAVATTHPYFSRERAEAVAASILDDVNIQAILRLRSGDLALSSTPEPGTLEHLFLRPEFRNLEPLKIKLHADDTSDLGETLDLQKVLRLYFGVSRDNMLDAVGMSAPHLSQAEVAEVVRMIWETEAVRRVCALRKGAE